MKSKSFFSNALNPEPADYGRMVGGKMGQMNASSLKKIAKRFFGQHKHSGGAISGGSMSGGGAGGADKLSKYY
jgi:S-formylglutathione hydrolase FrmB